MKTRTLLVDSSFLIKRSINGARDVYTKNFGHIGGLYSFLTKVRMLIKEHKFNKVVLVWDGENGGFYRYLLNSEYKANRKDKHWHEKITMTNVEIKKEEEKQESILKQKKRIQAYAEELFLRQIEVDSVEADDLIAAYAERYHDNENVFIYTNDRDFSQLLNKDVTILFDNIDEPITKYSFFFKFKYHYSNSLIMKTICGDTSDNIKGVGGIKEPTLLKDFPDLKVKHVMVREICRRADNINKERIKNKKKPLKKYENLLNNIDRLKLNYKLMNLNEPFLTDDAYEELAQLEMPLSSDDRGSHNLLAYMKEDEFLTIYTGSFVEYVSPFYSVITKEQQILKEYLKNERKPTRKVV